MKTKKLFNKLTTLTLLFIMHITASAQVQWALDTVISTGAYSSGISITPDNSKIIVTNKTTPGTIKVISTSDYSISSISYPADGYPNGVAVTPDGLTAVVNTMNQTIFIDLLTNSVSRNFVAPCVATTLYGIAVTPNGNNAIIPDLSSGCTQQGLRSINITTPSGSSFIQVNTSGVLYGIAITPDGTSAIVTTYVLGSPKKVNLLTSEVQNISGMTGSYGVAILHNGNEALIEGDSLKRVSLTSNKATKTISDIYSTTFQSIAITADDKYAFVVGDFKKIVVSLTDNTVIQTFSAGGTNVATTSDGSRFFVTDSYNGTVRVYKKIITTGMDVLKKGMLNVTFYPNPTSGKFTIKNIELQMTNCKLEIYNVLGEKIFSNFKFNQQTSNEIDLSNSPKGSYFVKIFDGEKTYIGKIVKQ